MWGLGFLNAKKTLSMVGFCFSSQVAAALFLGGVALGPLGGLDSPDGQPGSELRPHG